MLGTKSQIGETSRESLPIQDIDYLEIYTGNAKQAAYYYSKLLGFRIVGFSGLETGDRDKISYVLEQGGIRILISGAYSTDHPISDFVKKHGDGVRDIAFQVQDIEATYRKVVQNGGIPIREPYSEEDEFGCLKKAVIGTFGATVHTFVEREEYKGIFAPGFHPIKQNSRARNTGLTRFDHLAICVEDMNEWLQYYADIFGFGLLKVFKKEDISSKRSALMTKILQNGTERIKFSIIEPAVGKKKSQIREYLDYNNGAGVQHIAFQTDNILNSVKTLQRNGLNFLDTPETYYEMLHDRVGALDEPVEELRKLRILADRDDEGYLLQIFGHPVNDRPTLFFEVIQRKGSKGFGNGNIRALFEAVEREQAKRGNL
ncbi:4-hydroxyphenylpyruvate dioxygenase [Cohnella faecalis]|uniref:4-hydroxyphenylpyruvate dioxygenase n=1 Tax=Cohnella faecalis TaxID=2315694 RepID=UPI0036100CE1